MEQLLHAPGQTWGDQRVSVSVRELEGDRFQLAVCAGCRGPGARGVVRSEF